MHVQSRLSMGRRLSPELPREMVAGRSGGQGSDFETIQMLVAEYLGHRTSPTILGGYLQRALCEQGELEAAVMRYMSVRLSGVSTAIAALAAAPELGRLQDNLDQADALAAHLRALDEQLKPDC